MNIELLLRPQNSEQTACSVPLQALGASLQIRHPLRIAAFQVAWILGGLIAALVQTAVHQPMANKQSIAIESIILLTNMARMSKVLMVK